MPVTSPQTAWRSFLYGGGATLLAFDIFFLAKSAVQQNFVPVVPILAGILTAGGLLVVVYGEHRARELDKRDHRRISRVATQLEAPLQSLQEDLEGLLKQADTLPAEARLQVKRMQTKSNVILENIRDVFLMLQAQEKTVAQNVRVYDICTLVKEAVDRNRQLASARNVELLEKMHCADAPVRVDKRFFLIALSHIIENAILFTLTPGLVNVAVIKGTKQVRIVVQDRGVGITEEDEHTVFEPFARGRAADQFHQDGIGVGLTLGRLIVKEFHGTLTWKRREKGTGSQFEIRLPLAKV